MSTTPRVSGPEGGDDTTLEARVTRAQEGDADALASVILAIREDVNRLALRFLWHPQDAEDATQDILLRVITRLSSFRGESSFRTWVYRVSSNALLTMRKGRADEPQVSFDEFSEALTSGLTDEAVTHPDVDQSLLFEEVKIGCTTAMLLCLDRPHRLAYVLGEILELDHKTASEALEVTLANYRKRLSRARSQITDLMQRRCGLFDPTNPCRCHRRLRTAIELGRVDPDHLLFASSRETARLFPEVLVEIRSLDELERAAALYRSHSYAPSSIDIVAWLRSILEGTGDQAHRWAAWN